MGGDANYRLSFRFIFVGSVCVFTSMESWLVMSVLHDYDPQVLTDESDDTWRSIDALCDLTGMDIHSVVHEFGLGFVEEHGVHIGTVVDAIYLNELDWLIAR
jgi:hypothetical protein